MRILVVEDDEPIVRFLERGLSAHGHQVVSAATGADGVEMAAEPTIDLVILDIALPEMDGHRVLARIRARKPALPVIMLTARDEMRDRVGALNAGADDYLTKPFAFEELLARIHALLRRSDQPLSVKLAAGNLQLDLLSRRAWRADRPIELSSREFALLEYFMRHPEQVLSREQLLSGVWSYEFDPSSNIVEVYVRYLRRKIDEPGTPSLIATVRGAGYRFSPPTA